MIFVGPMTVAAAARQKYDIALVTPCPTPAAMTRSSRRFALLLLVISAPLWAADKVDFRRDIQPILADKCFVCHGRDAEHRRGELRLDDRDAALKGGQTGERAIVPGKADQSELVRRIEAQDDSRMPPPKYKKQLTDAERQLLRRWVADGAEYKSHWAFEPPVRPQLPEVTKTDWVRNDIDRFVLARLEKEGLTPSSETDKVTLLRRITLDLTGLPPTLAEVDAFVADKSAEAYGKVVQRLLDSPHYGERWGRIWLDGARYADSDGYEKDKPRFVWAYRDWVVAALNRDLPYNQFLIEQLAGDLLPKATQDQIAATGFLRNSMINEEGGIDPEQFRMEAMFDRMDALGKSMLGLTIQCAQCHDHKYDPLTQEDYYRVFAFFNDTHEANVAVYTAEEQTKRAAILREIGAIEAELKRTTPDWEAKLDTWAKSVAKDQPMWTIVSPTLDASGGQKHYVLKDGSILAAGYAPTKHTTEFTVKTELENVTAIRLELLMDPNLPLGGPGRSIKGTSALTEFKVEAGPANGSAGLKEVKVISATADVNPTERELDTIYFDKSNKRRVTGPIEFAIDGKDETAWGTDIDPGRRNQPRKAVFLLEKSVSFPGGTLLKIKLVQNHGGWNSDDNQNHNLGRFRFSVTTQPESKADPLPALVRRVVESWGDEHTPAEMSAAFSHFRATIPEWKEANEKIEALWKQHPEGASQLALHSREMDNHRPTFMLARGDFLKPTREVQPGTPGFLHKLNAEKPTRLDFARWLVDEKAPTTARAIVNRVWQAYFGTGLTATSEDFGTQGEAPSHPELLDYLATELIREGWSLKKLQRMIVNSATYRQSSRVSPELLARDPENRLLARGPRFRMEAESVRDIALAASGLLNEKVGGPPAFPPAPDFLFLPPASYGPKVWKEEKGENRYRRALYTFRFRSVPYPVLQAFDAPNGDFACVRRVRSNTPLQALATLNEPLFLECARNLALKTLGEGGATDKDRIAYAFRRCVSRLPDEAETAAIAALLERQLAAFNKTEAKPWELAANDPNSPPQLPAGITPAQAAAWTVVSRVLLNMDETITKE
jgi:hypothetical protein